jgi:hypothetical protein
MWPRYARPVRAGRGAETRNRRDDPPVAEEPLALYVVEDEPAVADSGERRRRVLMEGVVALGRAVAASSERESIPPPEVATGPRILERAWRERATTRHLHAHPLRAQAAFDRWIDRAAGVVATRAATLRLDRPVAVDAGRLRAVPGRLELRRLPVPVGVELELVAWGGWRAAVSLRPSSRWSPSLAWHQARGYFAGAHAVMDEIMRALRTDVERLD